MVFDLIPPMIYSSVDKLRFDSNELNNQKITNQDIFNISFTKATVDIFIANNAIILSSFIEIFY